jgi:uncharacterized protein (TIGR02147 family)
MTNIFKYMDYREYLEDFYHEKKKASSAFSYQVFADKSGLKSKSFLKEVIDGKKNLTHESAMKINRVLGLGDRAFAYFLDLIEFNQAKSLDQKNYYFERISSYDQRNSARLVQRQQYDFYSHWYHNTIRELAVYFDFKEDFELLGKMVHPPISARKARQSVELLMKLGLLQKTPKGYRQTDAIITTGNVVWSLAVQNFHLQNMTLAASSIESVAREQRDISCLVVGLSRGGLEIFTNEIEKLRLKLLRLAEKETNVQRVYHVNFQVFPTSEDIINEGM